MMRRAPALAYRDAAEAEVLKPNDARHVLWETSHYGVRKSCGVIAVDRDNHRTMWSNYSYSPVLVVR